jgi:hypothetical protein
MEQGKEGVLWKQGKERHNWKRRHFTVTQEDSTKRWVLSYFTDDAKPQKKGELFFDSTCTVMTGEGKDSRRESKRQSKRWSKTGNSGSTEYRFVINFPKRQLLLSAQSKMEMDDWIRYFQEIINSQKPQDGMSTALGVTSPLHETEEGSEEVQAGKKVAARSRGTSHEPMGTVDVHVDEHRARTNKEAKEFMQYKVRVTHNNSRTFSFWCRYSEISMMHTQIETIKELDGITFPGKGFLGMVDLDQRRQGLDDYFQALSSSPNLLNEKQEHALREFLRLDKEDPEQEKEDDGDDYAGWHLDIKETNEDDEEDMPKGRGRAPTAADVFAEIDRKMTIALDGEDDDSPGKESAGLLLLSLLLLGLLPIFVFLTLMSDLKFGPYRLGYGVAVYKWLHAMEALSNKALGLVFVEFFVLYLLDVSYWDGRWALVRKYLFAPLGAFGLVVGALAMTSKYAAAPLGIFFVLLAAYTDLLSGLLHPQHGRAKFFLQLSSNLGMTAVLMIVMWVVHTFALSRLESVAEGEEAAVTKEDNLWSNKLKAEYKVRLGCSEEESCLAAYLIWSAPLVAALACALIGIFARLLGRSLSRDKSFGMIRLVIATTAGMGFLCWSAASIAAGGTGVSDVIFSLVTITTIVLLLMLIAGLGWESLKHSVQSVPLMQKLGGIAGSDWVKSFMVLVCWLPFLFYLALSALNQLVRVHLGWHPATALHEEVRSSRNVSNPTTAEGGAAGKGTEGTEGTEGGMVHPHHATYSILTQVAANQIHILHGWRWSSVLCKTMYWAVGVLSLGVGVTKVVTVFLSWLNSVLSPLPTGVVIGLFYAIGLSMFLNPAIPGVPVYLSGGVIVVNKLLPQDKLESGEQVSGPYPV